MWRRERISSAASAVLRRLNSVRSQDDESRDSSVALDVFNIVLKSRAYHVARLPIKPDRVIDISVETESSATKAKWDTRTKVRLSQKRFAVSGITIKRMQIPHRRVSLKIGITFARISEERIYPVVDIVSHELYGLSEKLRGSRMYTANAINHCARY